MVWLLFLSFSVFAQDGMDLSTVRALEKDLPNREMNDGGMRQRIQGLSSIPPVRAIKMPQIISSGEKTGHVKPGRVFIRISDNKAVVVQDSMFVKFYQLQDEHGFKYLINKDGTCTYKILGDHVDDIEQELSLHVPPLRYTPAPENIVRAEYDKKFKFSPEFSFYAGIVQGDFMEDLFNDDFADRGYTTQYGAHLASDWNLPLQVGAVVHYEKSTYKIRGGSQIIYSSVSFGPQFKTKNFDIYGKAIRFQSQFRVSPFAEASAETKNGHAAFKFNSADFLISAEHPIKNKWGEYVWGFFFQSQWLNIKDQSEIVSVDASNQTNKSFGFSLSQVIQ